ncbi:hypothetical protein [Acidipila sp. EB88]|uniref:hypothetical protein n=1 Tax=Acidipila sp. EB88 TaxID=2305226 RepID=UPI000F5E946D|nr:hypothetical protein [Acidipila sp. EB88]
MIETEQPEGLSARKLVVETARHNVLTAYNSKEGLDLLHRFPKVDAVLVHAQLAKCEEMIAEIRRTHPEMPIIVASPMLNAHYPGATFVIPSHEPAALLDVLSKGLHLSIKN